MVYTVTLNPAIDYIVKVKKPELNNINTSVAEKICYGGKGINVSAMLTKLGIQNTALGFLGGFTGEKLEQMLKSENINCDFNYIANGNTRINIKIRAEHETDINALGPTVTDTEVKALLNKLKNIKFNDCNDCIVLAGSVPPCIPKTIYDDIFDELKNKNIKFIVDTTGSFLKNTLKYKPFLIKPNHHELGDLFNVKIKSEKDAVKYAGMLQKAGAENVLVSMAENGAILVAADGSCFKSENSKGVLVNSVGCGDSMVAGFIAGYIKTNNYAYALALGTACGNATAFCDGLGEKDKIDEILNNKIKISQLNF